MRPNYRSMTTFCIASVNSVMTFSAYKSDRNIFYKQFNFGLAPQTFGLVTSSNSLPEGQPHLFIFISPCWVLKQLFLAGYYIFGIPSASILLLYCSVWLINQSDSSLRELSEFLGKPSKLPVMNNIKIVRQYFLVIRQIKKRKII